MNINSIEAVFRLPKDKYPERKRTTIVITDEGDKVIVGVKALARVFEKAENGCINVTQEQWGEYSEIDRDAPVSKLLDTLNELFDKVPEIIER